MSNDDSMTVKTKENKFENYQCAIDGVKGGFPMFKLHFIGLLKKKLYMQLRD